MLADWLFDLWHDAVSSVGIPQSELDSYNEQTNDGLLAIVFQFALVLIGSVWVFSKNPEIAIGQNNDNNPSKLQRSLCRIISLSNGHHKYLNRHNEFAFISDSAKLSECCFIA